MNISTAVLPDSSPWIPFAYQIALDLVNATIAAVSSDMYALAVYNLGGSNLLEYAQDLPGAPNVLLSQPPAPYFANARQVFNLNSFVPGVITASTDEATSQTLVVQEAAKNFTMADLQYLKTPYGRTYLSIAQKYGQLWGVS